MKIRVVVVYALASRQWAAALDLPAGSSVRDALSAAAAMGLVPEADRAPAAVGIWGRVVALDTPLREADRVEIYRPLRADPKTARRQRAARPKRG